MLCLHKQDVLYSESLEFKAHSNPHNKRQDTDASLQVAEVVDGSKRRYIDTRPFCSHCHKPGHLIDSCWMETPDKKRAFKSKKGGPSQPNLSLNIIPTASLQAMLLQAVDNVLASAAKKT